MVQCQFALGNGVIMAFFDGLYGECSECTGCLKYFVNCPMTQSYIKNNL